MSNPLTKYIVYKLCASYAKVDLMSGVTTIRTVGGLDDIDSKIRDASEKGKLAAPRVIASNMAVSVEGGHMAGLLAYEAKDPEDGRNYVRKIAQTKPDLIKLMITGGVLDAEKEGEPGVLRMSPEIVAACCDEAHKLGFKVAAHVESPLGVKVALKGGVDTIEHGAALDDEDVELFKAHKAAHVLTISPTVPLCMFEPEVSGGTELHRKTASSFLKACLTAPKMSGGRSARRPRHRHRLPVRHALRYVARIRLFRQIFESFKRFRLKTATIGNAKIAGIDNVTGSVEVGKSADFLIVAENPLEDISALRRPETVVLRGKIYRKPKVKNSNTSKTNSTNIFEKGSAKAELFRS